MAVVGHYPPIPLDFMLAASVTVHAANGLPGLPGSFQYKGSDWPALEQKEMIMATNSKQSKPVSDRIADKPVYAGPALKAKKTKKAHQCTLQRRKGGASLATLQKELGWQPHTVRAAISGVRKAGETVECLPRKTGPTYRIVKEADAL